MLGMKQYLEISDTGNFLGLAEYDNDEKINDSVYLMQSTNPVVNDIGQFN